MEKTFNAVTLYDMNRGGLFWVAKGADGGKGFV